MERKPTPRLPAWCWLGLLATLVFDLWWRGHTVGPTLRDRYGLDLYPVTATESEPLDCDEAAYAYMGRRIVRGDVLYRDLTENKPPLGYWTYALAVAIGGAEEFTIRVMPLPLVLATIGLVWWLGLRIGGPAAAIIVAASYAVLSTDPFVFGNGANLEHAINLFAAASLAAIVRGWDRPGRRWLVVAGACAGAAALVKQVAALHLILYAAALLVRQGRGWRSRLADAAAVVVGFAAAWLVTIGVLVARGAGRDAFEDIVRYGGALATDVPAEPGAPPFLVRWFTGNADPQGRLPWPFGATDYLVWWGTGSWPAWLAGAAAVLWLGLGRPSGPRRLAAAWTVSAWVQVAAPGLFWQHYYLLPLPGLAVCLGVAAADAWARGRPAGRRLPARFGGVLLALSLAATAGLQAHYYLSVPPPLLTARYKGGGQWIALRLLGRELEWRSRVWPEPRLYLWGWQSPLFIYGELDGTTRHFFADPLLKTFATADHPLIRPRVAEIMSTLQARPPELIFAGDPPFPELRRFLEQHGYRRSRLGPIVPDGRGLWVEPGRFEAFEAAAPPRGRPS